MLMIMVKPQPPSDSETYVEDPSSSCLVAGRCCRSRHNTVLCGMSEWGCMVMQLTSWGWSYRRMEQATGIVASNYTRMKLYPEYQPFYSLGARFRRFYVRQAIAERKRRQAEKKQRSPL